MSRFTLLACIVLITSSRTAHASTHVVQPGQSLWSIAERYGCTVTSLRQRNQLSGDLITPGQRLSVDCASQAQSAAEVVRYAVQPGDTLTSIAARFATTIDELIRRNELHGDVIYAGQSLAVQPGSSELGRPVIGQSVGRCNGGRLVGGMQLGPGAGYVVRRADLAWGAQHTVQRVRRAIAYVRRQFPRVHALAVGDISAERGGRLPDHRSHQSGRDVDIGLYFHRLPRGYPEEFAPADARTLNFAATWALIEALAATASEDGGVQVIFLNYGVQQMLYAWARKQPDISRATLEAILQYPRGQGAAAGIVRHTRGHYAHLHVRFRCPTADPACVP